MEAARKRADELMESLIREEDQRQARQQLRKQKAEVITTCTTVLAIKFCRQLVGGN